MCEHARTSPLRPRVLEAGEGVQLATKRAQSCCCKRRAAVGASGAKYLTGTIAKGKAQGVASGEGEATAPSLGTAGAEKEQVGREGWSGWRRPRSGWRATPTAW